MTHVPFGIAVPAAQVDERIADGRRIRGHELASLGLIDATLGHPRREFGEHRRQQHFGERVVLHNVAIRYPRQVQKEGGGDSRAVLAGGAAALSRPR